VRDLAAAVADAAPTSFLVARYAAARLRAAPAVQDPADPRWRATLADGVVGVFRADLHDVSAGSPHPPEHLLAALRASALAFGAGIPWSGIWPAATRAVLGLPVLGLLSARHPGRDPLDAVIGMVLGGRLAGYLAQDIEDDRYVYRPAHERVREALRDAPASLLRRGSDS
jgi:hypothetical protein